MGLDGVELVIAIEEKFDIAIDDLEAQVVRTPAQLMDLVASKVEINRSDKTCMTQRAFHRLRREFMDLSPGRRADFRLEQDVRRLLPWIGKRGFLSSWAKELGIKWLPGLYPVTLLGLGLAAMPFAVGAGTYEMLGTLWISIPMAFIALIGGIFVFRNLHGVGIIWVGGKVRSVVEGLVSEYPSQFRVTNVSWSREELRTSVRAIIKDQLGIKEFDDDADFVDDLGLS